MHHKLCTINYKHFSDAVKADPGPAHRARAPLFGKFGGFVFVDCITRLYFHCSHHTVLTICTLLSVVTKKNRRTFL